jgi:hypothetical protein
MPHAALKRFGSFGAFDEQPGASPCCRFAETGKRFRLHQMMKKLLTHRNQAINFGAARFVGSPF